MQYDDTIAALSTPIGESGIGIVRLSGKDAIAVADALFSSPNKKRLRELKSHTLIHGFIINPATGEKVDEVLVSVMHGPKTYTREDVVEINCHGGIVPLRAILELLLRHGARSADPGEFTRRAFLNGRLDLSQAEAVIDLIKAKTDKAEKLALQQLEGRLSAKITSLRDRITSVCVHCEAYIDFPEEEIEPLAMNEMTETLISVRKELASLSKGYNEGRLFREGVSVAIVGKPNVGKSSLLNALLNKDRAIVTELPGTTRDVIEDYLNVKGLPVRIMDTAGIREAHDLAEVEGVRRSLKALEGADIVIAVLDASRALDDADRELLEKIREKKALIAVNKSDARSKEFRTEEIGSLPPLFVSALREEGIDALKELLYERCITRDNVSENSTEGLLLTNIRHKTLIDKAAASILSAEEALTQGEPLEVVALFLRDALDHLGEIVGIVTTDDILDKIFSEFCIGK